MTMRLHVVLQPVCAAVLFVSGCDYRPKATYESSRRILALEVWETNRTAVTIKYFPNTNDQYVIGGDLGSFQGDLTAVTVSSNAREWRLLLGLKGITSAGVAVDLTNALNVSYAQFSRSELLGIGTVTGWFLSDEELLAFDKRMPK